SKTPSSPPPPLSKIIAIPRVCNISNRILPNLPFIRAYAPILSTYNIPSDIFLSFIDELNILQAGHPALTHTHQPTQPMHFTHHLDPTKLTTLMTQCTNLAARLLHTIYIQGPCARRTAYLKLTNQTLFHPNHLHVDILTGKALRKLLDLHPEYPLCAELCPAWTVPEKADLMRGVRASVRVPGRQLYQLIDYVHDLDLAAEVKGDWKEERGEGGRRDAAKVVRDWQVVAEVQHEVWRGEALRLYEVAGRERDLKRRRRLVKMAGERDLE
ncbi:hypothetical protein BO78DRAFT_286857, partial [Aspergillus sclerotiicarbonarius CBS 121057]